jgi:hypothetical protein
MAPPGKAGSNHFQIGKSQLYPHPYFGYVLNKNFEKAVRIDPSSKITFEKIQSTPQGFLGDTLHHAKSNPDECVIGIFGGSVAYFYGSFQKKYPGRWHFKLDRPVRVGGKTCTRFKANFFAQPGYKEPQQSIVFLKYMDFIDVMVNIAGWNELFEPYLNIKAGLRPDFPFFSASPYFMFESFISEYPSPSSKADVILDIRLSIYDLYRHSVCSYSYICKSILKLASDSLNLYEEKLRNDFADQRNKNRLSDLENYYFKRELTSDKAILSKNISTWMDYWEKTHILAAKKGIPDIFIFQPALDYRKGKDAIHEEELKILKVVEDQRGKSFPSVAIVNQGYDMAIDELTRQVADGKPYFALPMIFKSSEGKMYKDPVHLTPDGYDILHRHILNAITNRISMLSKTNNTLVQ